MQSPLENPWEDLTSAAEPEVSAPNRRETRVPIGERTEPLPAEASCKGVGKGYGHIPCLLADAVREMLNPSKRTADGLHDGFYVDCTFGRGGHSRHILSQLSSSGRLLAFDVDPTAVEVAKDLARKDPRFQIAHRPFAELKAELGDAQIDGIMMDLGVSSPQLDERHRGFSVSEDAPLDLRMNQQAGIPAWKWVQEATREELAWVIREYGEDGDPIMAERIADAIKTRQDAGFPAHSTRQFADIVRQTKPIDERGQHPAKLTFQAIRTFLNQEMEQLDTVLHSAMDRLHDYGNCVVIVFKRKESAAVLKFLREHEQPSHGPGRTVNPRKLMELYPLLGTQVNYSVQMTKEPIKPSSREIAENFRSRSSVVLVLQKQPRRLRLDSESCPRLESERFRKPVEVPTFTGCGEVQSNGSTLHPHEASPREPHSSAIGEDPARNCATLGSVVNSNGVSGNVASLAASASSSTAEPEASSCPEEESAGLDIHELVKYTVAECIVRKCFNFHEPGYLNIQTDQVLRIFYRGMCGNESGWLYGSTDDGRSTGWFPASHIDEILDC